MENMRLITILLFITFASSAPMANSEGSGAPEKELTQAEKDAYEARREAAKKADREQEENYYHHHKYVEDPEKMKALRAEARRKEREKVIEMEKSYAAKKQAAKKKKCWSNKHCGRP